MENLKQDKSPTVIVATGMYTTVEGQKVKTLKKFTTKELDFNSVVTEDIQEIVFSDIETLGIHLNSIFCIHLTLGSSNKYRNTNKCKTYTVENGIISTEQTSYV